MIWTQKETMLLEELKSQEQLCAEKYRKYAQDANDGNLKALFERLGGIEQGHLNTINEMLAGKTPSMGGSGQTSQSAAKPNYPSNTDSQAKQADGYLCSDALTSEKHASSLYDTCIFEFKDENARKILNHIQTEEQGHGKQIYDYMTANGLYS